MKNQIECPGCGHKIDVEQIIYGQIEAEIKSDFSKKASEDKIALELKLRKQITDEKNEELSSYQQELREKSEQLKDLNKTKAELLRAQREKDELKTQIEAEAELKLSETLNSERAKMRRDFDEKSNLKIAEKEHLIESLKTQVQSLTRKIEQGSMQVQGEVQEIALENYLRDNFPLDKIEEVKKGHRGADCLQTVNSRTRLGCGSIYYESKRTKEFSSA